MDRKKSTASCICIVFGLTLLLSGMFADRLVKMPNTLEYNGVQVSYYTVAEGTYRVFVEVFITENRQDLLIEGNSVDLAVLRWARIKGWNVNRTEFGYIYFPVLLFGEYGSRRLVGFHADGGYYFGVVVDFSDTANYRVLSSLMELEGWGNEGSIRIGEITINFDLPIVLPVTPLPESFRESESKLFSENEQPLLKPTKIDVEVPGKAVKAMRNLIWAGAALTVAGLTLFFYGLIEKGGKEKRPFHQRTKLAEVEIFHQKDNAFEICVKKKSKL